MRQQSINSLKRQIQGCGGWQVAFKLTAFELSTWTGPKLCICHLNVKISKILNKTIQDCFKYLQQPSVSGSITICAISAFEVEERGDHNTLPPGNQACKPTSNQLGVRINHWPSTTKCLFLQNHIVRVITIIYMYFPMG